MFSQDKIYFLKIKRSILTKEIDESGKCSCTKEVKDKQTNERTKGQLTKLTTNGQKYKRKDEQTNKQTNEQATERTKGQLTKSSTNGQKDKRKDEQTNKRTNVRKDS
jgi:hypothetical protein